MKKGITATGFEYEIGDQVGNDWETFELVAEIQSGKESYLPLLLKRILGNEQTAKLKEHCRNSEGIVETSRILEEVTSIFEGQAEIKNS